MLADSLNEELGNHSDRPEVVEAIRYGEGEATPTLGYHRTGVPTWPRPYRRHIGRAAMPISSPHAVDLPGILGLWPRRRWP